jgi:hypothetical protein
VEIVSLALIRDEIVAVAKYFHVQLCRMVFAGDRAEIPIIDWSQK